MHICGLVTLAEQREVANGPPLVGQSRKTAWVTSEAMEEWLVEVGFVEELFGSSMHVELVGVAVGSDGGVGGVGVGVGGGFGLLLLLLLCCVPTYCVVFCRAVVLSSSTAKPTKK